MEKMFFCLLILTCALVFLSSCSSPNVGQIPSITESSPPVHPLAKMTDTDYPVSNTEQATGDTPVIYDDYFDRQRLHKPTHDDVMAIREGMDMMEIIQQIGKPHDVGPLSGTPSLEWQTADGATCWIVLSIPAEAPTDMPAIDRLMKYGVAVRVILRGD